MKRILVTGGAGFIGSNFIHYLLRTDAQVQIVNLDALTYAGSLENLKGLPDESRHTFVKGDITDHALLDELFAQHTIDTVVHFAAESHVDRSILDPGVFVNTNVIGTFTLLEAARKAWLVDKLVPGEQVRFHHVSTDEVFGTLSETAPAFGIWVEPGKPWLHTSMAVGYGIQRAWRAGVKTPPPVHWAR